MSVSLVPVLRAVTAGALGAATVLTAVAPASAKASAAAHPTPREPPVMRMRRPV